MSPPPPPPRQRLDLRSGARGATLGSPTAAELTARDRVRAVPRAVSCGRRGLRALLLVLVGVLAAAAGACTAAALYWNDVTDLGVRVALQRLGPDGPAVSVGAVEPLGLQGLAVQSLAVAAPRPLPDRPPLLRLTVTRAELRASLVEWLLGEGRVEAIDLVAPALELDLRSGPRELVAQLRRLRRAAGHRASRGGAGGASASPTQAQAAWPRVRVRQGRLDVLGWPYALRDVVLEADPRGADLVVRGGFRPVGLESGRCTLTGQLGAQLAKVTAELQCSPALELRYGAVVVRAGRLSLSHGGAARPSPIPPAERERLGLVAEGPPTDAGWVVDLPNVEVVAPVPGDPTPRTRLSGAARLVLGATRELGLQTRLGTEAGGRVLMAGVVRLRERAAALDLLVEEMDLARSPVAALLPGTLQAGRLSADVALDLVGRGQRMDVIGRVEAKELSYLHDRIAQRPVEVAWAGADLDLEIDLGERRVETFGTRLVVNNLPVIVDGVVDLGHAEPRLQLSAQTGKLAGDEIVRSIPTALLDRLRGLRLEGSASFGTTLALDLAKPEDLDLEVHADTRQLTLLRVGSGIDLRMLREPFLHVWEDAERRELYHLETGPGSPAWTPLHELPDAFIQAVLAQEDGGFYRHHGFSMLHVKGSLVRNLRERRFARGASTLTMQLARNLFLGRAKRISRKLQEVVVAWALERELSKRELLALYLNVIEWGPGVFGIGHAATHYFGRPPSELSLREVVFLSTAIPRPRPVHGAFSKGRVLRTQQRRIDRMLRLLVRRGHVDAQAAAEAQSSELRFDAGGSGAPLPNRWGRGSRPRRGRHQVRPSELPPDEGPPTPPTTP